MEILCFPLRMTLCWYIDSNASWPSSWFIFSIQRHACIDVWRSFKITKSNLNEGKNVWPFILSTNMLAFIAERFSILFVLWVDYILMQCIYAGCKQNSCNSMWNPSFYRTFNNVIILISASQILYNWVRTLPSISFCSFRYRNLPLRSFLFLSILAGGLIFCHGNEPPMFYCRI